MNNANKSSNIDPKIPYQKIVPKPWGHEVIFTPEEVTYTGKIMVVDAGKRWSIHYHDAKLETLTLLSGKGILWLVEKGGNTEKIEMEERKGYTIPVNQTHRFEAVTDCIVVEASEPEKGITVRVEDDFERKDETEEVRENPNRGWKI